LDHQLEEIEMTSIFSRRFSTTVLNSVRIGSLFLVVVFICTLAYVATAKAGDVIVNCCNELAALVKISPPAANFVLSPGKHYTGEVQPSILIAEEGRKNEFLAHFHDYPTYVSRREVVASNDITFYRSMGVSGFHSSRGPIEDLAEKNRFEASSIQVVQGFTLLHFRFGSDNLDLEGTQKRGQELHSRIEFTPSGTFPNFDKKCPPGVGRSGAP
jgi:hypothetical protein